MAYDRLKEALISAPIVVSVTPVFRKVLFMLIIFMTCGVVLWMACKLGYVHVVEKDSIVKKVLESFVTLGSWGSIG